MIETDNSSLTELSPRERRMLQWMRSGNRIFEVVEKKYFTVYNDKANRDRRIKKEEIVALEQAGWITAVPNPAGQRLDSWQISERCKAALSVGR